ncbi:type I-C CRISPR-associated protein Cas8c/Csd1 [Jannaschia rubra]|uniref:CRISPR-associated protein Cas8c/Csd1, subtype I-C/DVULG n=1 Tax=Jannaschia rubra TaxID=282197 RepID=A0A0M6XPQ1_9RHOB|nr:type I-C CRISPR-associated protein Cas8c/Csd1 [Jannaschia rubra]CTQ33130.1 CRISPR-associated protein Cas8c/Csd1, subtype I-C/DVULG [Jannaschia rubra]SFG83403.1 CRISPR-associated protein, Csd1 family [Jannaschia rubra]
MTILQELAALYEARAEQKGWPRPGFSTEKIGAVVVLDGDGAVTEIRSLMAPDAKDKMQARPLSVPAAVKRTAGVKPNTFWDKTAYVLGVTKTPDGPGQGKRTAAEHEAFKAAHLELLDGADDPALVALRRFCETWAPERFAVYPDPAGLVDQNVVFRLGDGGFVHDLPAAQVLLTGAGEGDAICLVSGRAGPVARLHPSIKGVMGAQTAGASLVSFNDAAYESHGKKQGDNAPVSEAAAFAYGTALNALLAKGSGNHLRIGGDTVAFWAEEPEAENWFDAMLAGAGDPAAEPELADRLRAMAEGRRRADVALNPEARLFVLGLAPNAARLAVRYWHPGTLGGFARAVTRFWDDMAITPSPFAKDGALVPPKPWALLYDVAAQRDAGNIPAALGGELMRAILTGGRYPATWLAALLGRLRVEGEPDAKAGKVDGRRAAAIAAILRRNHGQEVPMALDEGARDAAYLLGRLFGAYVYAEKSYQERGAGLRQKYMGAASATPARVFPVLMRGYEHNLSSLRKAGGMKAGAGARADRAVAAIIDALEGEMPATLPLEAQGRFFIGFYHQISAFYAKPEEAADALIDDTDAEGDAA